MAKPNNGQMDEYKADKIKIRRHVNAYWDANRRTLSLSKLPEAEVVHRGRDQLPHRQDEGRGRPTSPSRTRAAFCRFGRFRRSARRRRRRERRR